MYRKIMKDKNEIAEFDSAFGHTAIHTYDIEDFEIDTMYQVEDHLFIQNTESGIDVIVGTLEE